MNLTCDGLAEVVIWSSYLQRPRKTTTLLERQSSGRSTTSRIPFRLPPKRSVSLNEVLAPSIPGESASTDVLRRKTTGQRLRPARPRAALCPPPLSQEVDMRRRDSIKQCSAHIFSNLSLVVHTLLPLLFRFSEIITRIQLRSTCRLYRHAYYSDSRLHLSIDDVLIYPLQFDLVLVRDWHVYFPSTTTHRTHASLALRHVFRPATKLELSSALMFTSSLTLYVFGRLPFISASSWTKERHVSNSYSRQRCGRCTQADAAGVNHAIFGCIDRERWNAALALSHFTVQDIARICASAYSPWHLPRDESNFVRLHQSDRVPSLDPTLHQSTRWFMRCALAIRWDETLSGYVLDPLNMPGYAYP
jgi:hypothetical protein